MFKNGPNFRTLRRDHFGESSQMDQVSRQYKPKLDGTDYASQQEDKAFRGQPTDLDLYVERRQCLMKGFRHA